MDVLLDLLKEYPFAPIVCALGGVLVWLSRLSLRMSHEFLQYKKNYERIQKDLDREEEYRRSLEQAHGDILSALRMHISAVDIVADARNIEKILDRQEAVTAYLGEKEREHATIPKHESD